MATHRIHVDQLPPVAAAETSRPVLVIDGEEAHHAIRVKRIEIGAAVEIRDGRGAAASARVVGTAKDPKQGWQLSLEVFAQRSYPRPDPFLEVCSAAPKGDHLEVMVDMLSQLGAGRWRPLTCDRSVVEPRAGKLDRLRRVAAESMKQCGRTWVLEIGEELTVDQAILGGRVFAADAAGRTPGVQALLQRPSGQPIRLLVGPEGGWSERELAAFTTAEVPLLRFAEHVLRIETAAVVGAAMVLHEFGRSG